MRIHQVCLLHDLFPTTQYYPFNLEIFHKTNSIEFTRPVTFFIGENGTGKSTLLKAIARKCTIHIWEENTRSRYHTNSYEDELQHYIDVGWNREKSPDPILHPRYSAISQRSLKSGPYRTRGLCSISETTR